MSHSYLFIIGIDISKRTFDVALGENQPNAVLIREVFENNLAGYKAFCHWLKAQDIALHSVLFCMENTGIYHRLLVAYLQSHGAYVWVETPVQLALSLGMVRGKTDPVDAGRIHTYAYRYQDRARDYFRSHKILDTLGHLLSARERIKRSLESLQKPIKELTSVGLHAAAKAVQASCGKSIKSLAKSLATVDAQILALIQADPSLHHTYKLVTSVKGVGFVMASYLLFYTRGFTRFDSVKQLAAYAGIAPFPYESGTSVKKRTRVHYMGNKILKKYLHLCALCVCRHDPELAAFFQRKVAEGKNKMSVINALRFKLLSRICSCVRNNRMYTPEPPPRVSIEKAH